MILYTWENDYEILGFLSPPLNVISPRAVVFYSQPPPDCWRCPSSARSVSSSLQVTAGVTETGCDWEDRPGRLCTTNSSLLLPGCYRRCRNCASPPEKWTACFFRKTLIEMLIFFFFKAIKLALSFFKLYFTKPVISKCLLSTLV